MLSEHGSFARGGRARPILICVAALVISTAAFACLLDGTSDETSADIYSGNCGTGLVWSYDTETKVLSISGDGTKMEDYDKGTGNVPGWRPHILEIRAVDMSKAINMTNVGSYAFYANRLSEVKFGPALAEISDHAFSEDIQHLSEVITKDISFLWHNGKIPCGASDCAGRTFSLGEEFAMWMSDMPKEGDKVALESMFEGTVVSASDGTCDVRIDGFLDGASLPAGGAMVIGADIKIWDGSGYNIDAVCRAIGTEAFADCTAIVSVSVPSTLTRIGDGAFRGCVSLASAEIRGTDAEIGTSAFEGCASLASLTLHEGVTEIKHLAFSGIGIERAVLPDSAVLASGDVFSDSVSMTGFEVKETNNRYRTDGSGVLYSKDGKTLVAAPYGIGTYRIPDGTESMSEGAFLGTLLSEAVLPESITTMPQNTFALCGSLAKVYAPGVLNIGLHAFQGTDLEVLVLSGSADKTVHSNAFPGYTFLLGEESVTVASEKFKSIGVWIRTGQKELCGGFGHGGIEYRFVNGDPDAATSVEAVDSVDETDTAIPDTVPLGGKDYRVTGINTLLENCENMVNLSIGANVAGLDLTDEYPFDDLTLLRSITVSPDNGGYASFEGALYSKDLRTLLRYPMAKGGPVSFAPGVETVGGSAFFNCTGIPGIVLPEGIKTLEPWSFRGDPFITAFTLPASLEAFAGAFEFGFWDGEALTDAEDVRGRSWKHDAVEDRYVRGVVVPGSVDGNVSFDAPYLFDLDDDAIAELGGNSATVSMDNGTVVFSADAVAGLKAGILTIGIADTSGYSDALKARIGDRPVFSVDFGDNKGFGGTVTVSLAYGLRDGEDASGIRGPAGGPRARGVGGPRPPRPAPGGGGRGRRRPPPAPRPPARPPGSWWRWEGHGRTGTSHSPPTTSPTSR